MAKHKHAEVIKAWADGAKIDAKGLGNSWYGCPTPTWDEGTEYRVHDPLREIKEAFARGEKIDYREGPTHAWVPVAYPGWFEDIEYRIHDPLREFKEAFARGEKIEAWNELFKQWEVIPNPKWRHQRGPAGYRIAPKVDPFRKLKEAYARGEKIEALEVRSGQWYPLVDPGWRHPCGPAGYRIAPKKDYANAGRYFIDGKTLLHAVKDKDGLVYLSEDQITWRPVEYV